MWFRRKVLVKQRDLTDCGAACLASVLAWYGRSTPVARIRQLASTDQSGTTVLGLMQAAERLGFQVKGVRGRRESLPEIPLPAIAHIITSEEYSHYVVIYRSGKQYVELMDPADGAFHRQTVEEFERIWTGVLVLLVPDGELNRDEESPSVASRFSQLLSPHRATLLQALFGAAVYTVTGLGTAIFIQLIVDHVLPAGNTNLLNLLGTVMLVLLLVQLFTGFTKSWFILKTGQLIDAQLILGYHKHLLKLPQRFFDSMRAGEIISRINDAVKIRAFINDTAIHLTVNLFIILFSFALMFTYYWKLGFLMLTMLPLCLLIYLSINTLNRKTQRQVMEDAARLETRLVETIGAISTIRQFNLQSDTHRKTETEFVRLLQSIYRAGLHNLVSEHASSTTARLFTLLLLWTGSILVLNGELSAGELLSFYAVTGYFTGPVIELIGMNRTVQEALIAGDRLFEILDLEPEEPEERVELPSEIGGSLRLEGVSFRYGSREVLFRDLDLEVPPGKITAFVGESGSGKSTLIRLLQKMYPLDRGRILLGDLNLDHVASTSLRERMSVVSQRVDLFAGTVLENIAVGDYNPDLQRIISICRDLGILEIIEELPQGLHTPVGERGATLSGGQQQRLAIARALYREPEILILDEATSSLDTDAELCVRRCVNRLRREQRMVLMVSHRLNQVVIADKICVLKKGQLIETGTHRELLQKNGEYRRLWDLQFPSVDEPVDDPDGELSSL